MAVHLLIRQSGIAALAAAALFVSSGCSEPNAAELVGSARAAIAAKDVDTAKQRLKAALQAAPDHAEAHLLLGQLLFQEGNMVAAELELRHAMQAASARDQVLPLLAEVMLATGKAAGVVQEFGTTLLADAAAQVRLRSALAQAEAAIGRVDDARRHVDELLATDPAWGPALLLQARLNADAGDRPGALQQVTELLRKHPDDANAWVLKGDLLGRAAAGPPRADPAEAVAAYREALRRRPDAVKAHDAIITLLMERNDLTGAIVQWNSLLKVAPRHPRTRFQEVVLCEARGDLDRARDVGQRLLRDFPEDPQLRLLVGRVALKQGSLVQAEAHLGMATQLMPGATPPRLLLAQVQLRAGQHDKALATLAPLADGAEVDVEALVLKAQVLQQGGDRAGADAAFARAARRSPDDPRVRTALAMSSLAQGRKPAQALAELRAVAAADKGTDTDLVLIEALMRHDDLPAALKAVDALAAKTPGDVAPDMLRARIALRMKDNPGARQHYAAALQKNAEFMPAAAGLAALDLADGHPAKAKSRYEAVLKRNGKSVPALLALAELHARIGGAAAETRAYLERAVAADPGASEPRVRLVDHLIDAGQAMDAADVAKVGLEAQAGDAELLDRLGRVQLALDEARQAVVTFNKLVAASPRSAPALLRLAEAQRAVHNPEGAHAAVRRAADLAPDLPAVQKALAEVWLAEDKPEQALAIARRMQAQRPDEGTGWWIEGEVELRRRNADAAMAALRKAVARPASGDAPALLHGALLAARRFAEADAFAADWRRQHPDDLGFALQVGDQNLALGKTEAASAVYKDVLQRRPRQAAALKGLALVLAMQKQPGAVAMAEKALAQSPGSGAMLDTLAFALASVNDLERAVEVQRQAVAASPEAHAFRLQLARLLIDRGDEPDARLELRTLAQLGPRFDRQAEVAELLKRTK